MPLNSKIIINNRYKHIKPTEIWHKFNKKLINKGHSKIAYKLICTYHLFLKKKYKKKLKLLFVYMINSMPFNYYTSKNKKYEKITPFVLYTNKKFNFFLINLIKQSKLRKETTFILRLVAETYDFASKRGLLYKFWINFLLKVWESRFKLLLIYNNIQYNK